MTGARRGVIKLGCVGVVMHCSFFVEATLE